MSNWQIQDKDFMGTLFAFYYHNLTFVFQAFSGTVIEKEFLSPSLTPHPAMAHPVLPTIPERKEVLSEVSEGTAKRVSKFKAARLQQKN